MKKLSVVMPVYGQWNLVKRNIVSLLNFDKRFIREIIVVDDCSPECNPYNFDESIVSILKNQLNQGYTSTVNVGLKKASSEIILLLDSDAYLIGPVAADIIEMYEQEPLLGCVGYRTLDDQGQTTGSFCYEPNTLGLILGQQLESRLNSLPSFKKQNILPYSCSVSFRKRCIEEMDYFDENQFPVLDADLDLSMRIHRSNWKLLFNENIVLSHTGGNSYKVNFKRVLLFHKSRWQLLRKHGLIKYPIFVKYLIKIRLKLELILLNVMCFFKKGDAQILDKQKGRRLMINELPFK